MLGVLLWGKVTQFTDGSTALFCFSTFSRARAVSDFGPYLSRWSYDIHKRMVLERRLVEFAYAVDCGLTKRM